MGNNEIKNIRSQKFFTDLNRINTQTINTNPNDLSENISLRVSITAIEKGCQYSVQMLSVNGQSKTSLNDQQNCVIDEITNSAVLTTSIIMKYFFEKAQPLTILNLCHIFS